MILFLRCSILLFLVFLIFMGLCDVFMCVILLVGSLYMAGNRFNSFLFLVLQLSSSLGLRNYSFPYISLQFILHVSLANPSVHSPNCTPIQGVAPESVSNLPAFKGACVSDVIKLDPSANRVSSIENCTYVLHSSGSLTSD
jgi:hypothetical protein